MQICSRFVAWCCLSVPFWPVAQACWPTENVVFLGHIGYEGFSSNPAGGNDCWGYTSPSGREYGLMGLRNAVAVIEVTSPSFPIIVAEIPHNDSNWGDIKVYGDYAYAVNETGGGMDIIDLSDVDNGVVTLVQRFMGFGLSTSHNVAIDTDSGFLYLCGSNLNQGRLVVYDLSDPENPALVGQMSATEGEYVHDAQVVTYPNGKQIAFAAVGGIGLDIYDVTDKSDMFRIAQATYPNLSYAHQCWTEDLQYLYLNDEADALNETVVFDISDLSAPFVAGTYNSGVPAEDHNLYVHNGFVYEADYRAGVRIFDAIDPVLPVQVGHIDTFPDDDNTGSGGAWSVYPFFASGNFIASDKDNGFFVGRLGSPPLLFSYPGGVPDRVDPSGSTFTAEITAQGGQVLDTASPALHYTTGGGTVSVPLTPLGGGLYEAGVGPLPCGSVTQFWLSADTVSGMRVNDPGAAPCDGNIAISAVTASVIVDDPLETLGQWIAGVPGDTATHGLWELADPVGTEGQPENDHSPDPDALCFITGQGDLLDPTGQADVDEGTTTLVTPALDLGGVEDATIRYWLWYDNDWAEISADEGTAPNADVFVVDISDDDGASWTPLQTIGPAGPGTSGGWTLYAARVTDFVAPTSEVRLRFVASDVGTPSLVEAALDDFGVTSITCDPAGAPGAGRVPDGAGPPGAPLRLTLEPSGKITLTWSPSCQATDTDYAIYQGTLGSFTDHSPVTCSTAGLTVQTISAAASDSYYLVVPQNAAREGSYGTDGQGAERPPSAQGCLQQSIQACDSIPP